MPVYHITAPNGTVHEITAPEGATEAQIMAYAQQQFARDPGITGLAGAVASGANRGFYADLLGLPVDTTANMLDLAKAAIGTGYNEIKKAVTGKPSVPPDWTMPYDRSQLPGTSEWIAAKARAAGNAIGVASPLDNPFPENAAARVLHSAGRGAGASIVPNPNARISLAQNAANMLKGVVSGGTAGAVNEVAPQWAGAAAMLPQLAGRAAVAAGKAALGGAAARQQVAQRVIDLQNGGVTNPSLGLATGSPFLQGFENLMAKVPGSVGVFQNANQANFAGMRDKLASLRDTASPSYGRQLVGADIQDDLGTVLPQRISQGYEGLLNKAVNIVGADTPIPVDNAIKLTGELTTPRPGAENISSLLVVPKISKIHDALVLDNAGPQPTNGAPPPPPLGIPFGEVRDLRTRIGQEVKSPKIIGTPEEGQYERLYGALSEDLRNGVNQADVTAGTPPNAAGSATQAWDRSNAFYAGGMDRVKRVSPFVSKVAPEQAYNALMSALTGNVSTFRAVKKSITPETRAAVAATALDDMGAAKSAYQNALGDVFSPETYLTQYDKMAPGRNELLSGWANAPEVRQGVDDIAHAASMLRDSSKIWANPSGSGANIAASAGIGGIAGNLITNPGAAVLGVGGLLGGNLLSRKVLLNPDLVNYLAMPPQPVPPYNDQSTAQRFINALSQSQ